MNTFLIPTYAISVANYNQLVANANALKSVGVIPTPTYVVIIADESVHVKDIYDELSKSASNFDVIHVEQSYHICKERSMETYASSTTHEQDEVPF